MESKYQNPKSRASSWGEEGAEALAQSAQKSCGCLWIPESVPDQVGWGLEQLGIVEVSLPMTG